MLCDIPVCHVYLGLGYNVKKLKLTLSKLNITETLQDFENTNVRCLMSCIFADVRMWYCIWPSRRKSRVI